jgi:hypothetical protein
MISTFMVDGPRTIAPFGRAAATVLAARADEARVLLHAVADEAMRYLYVVSLVSGGTLLTLFGLFIVLAVVITFGLSRLSTVPSPGLGLPASSADRKAA